MERLKYHLQNLVYFASVDKEFVIEEKNFIRQVGMRFGLDDEEISIIVDSKPISEPKIPESEVERYILFDDVLNLITIDRKVTEDEVFAARKLAIQLGFNSEIANDILNKLKRHIELDFDSNQISHSIKNSVFSLTNNIDSHGKHSM